MLECAKRCLATLRCANHQSALQQIGLIDILERTRVLAHRTGKRGQANGTAGERLGKCLQDANIHPVQAKLVDLEKLERLTADIKLNRPVAAHLRVVAHALEQIGFGLGAITRIDGAESVNTRDLARYCAAEGDFAKITEEVRKTR